MNDYNFEGASLYSKSGTLLGEVRGLHGQGDDAQLEVLMKDSDRSVSVPYIFLDTERSAGDDLYLTASEDDELKPYFTDESHDAMHFEAVEEELVTNVREVVQGRYIIEKTVDEVDERQDIELGTDVVDVERISHDELLTEAPQTRREGDVLIVPVIEEILVVEKRYKLVEEVRITTTRDTRTETVEETLRKERVTVTEERADGGSKHH